MTEWDQRELCSDGACVGVIGPSGLCKVCGRAAANWGDERNRGLTPLPPPDPSETDAHGLGGDLDDDDEDDDLDDEDQEVNDDNDDAPELADKPEDGDWQERKLCADDTCIGVIGADGRCKVCGCTAA